MHWVTRTDVRVGRIACTWLITRFIDPEADIQYLPGAEAKTAAQQEGVLSFHLPGVGFSHERGRTPFEAMLDKYGLQSDPALALLGRIVNGADTDNRLYNQPEGPGVRAAMEGFRALSPGNDQEILARGGVLFDALYAYCQEKTSAATQRTGSHD